MGLGSMAMVSDNRHAMILFRSVLSVNGSGNLFISLYVQNRNCVFACIVDTRESFKWNVENEINKLSYTNQSDTVATK